MAKKRGCVHRAPGARFLVSRLSSLGSVGFVFVGNVGATRLDWFPSYAPLFRRG